MAVLGSTATPNFANQFYLPPGNRNTAWFGFTMPSPGGTITDVNGFFDAESASGTGYVFVYAGGTGVLLASASVGSVAVGNNNIGGQHWHGASLSPGLYVASGASILLGFWLPQASGLTFSLFNGGSSGVDSETGTSPGGASGGQASLGGTIGVYADYTPGGAAYVNTGTPASPVWTPGIVQVNTGTPASPVWTQGTVYVNTGTPASPVWTPSS